MIYTPKTKMALKLCFEAHKEQVDKSGMPYVFHPFHLAEQMNTEETTIVALLHDLVEDTDYTIEALVDMGFDKSITDAIALMTHADNVAYMDYVRAIKDNPIAKAVKLADLKHNSDLTRLDTIDEKALQKLSNDNAQQEEYLSDLVQQVNILEPGSDVKVITVADKNKILGFNNPAELLEVERIIRVLSNSALSEINPTLFRSLKEWQDLLFNDSPMRSEFLCSIYGGDENIQKRQLAVLQELITKAVDVFSIDQKLLLVRSPGRLNVMGRHIDHQGGNCNLMTISFETVYLVAVSASRLAPIF